MTTSHPYVLIMHWQPTAAWAALTSDSQCAYLHSLDSRIAAGQAMGMQVLGWSPVNLAVHQSTDLPFVGVFGFSTQAQMDGMLADVAQSQWYAYFETRNTALHLQGIDSLEPSRVYARLLGLDLGQS